MSRIEAITISAAEVNVLKSNCKAKIRWNSK